MAVTTLLLTALVMATTAGPPHERALPQTNPAIMTITGIATEQAQRGQTAATSTGLPQEQTPAPNSTTTTNQGASKEEIREIVQQALAEQAEPPLISWIKIFLAAAALIVAVFTALIAAFGVSLIKFTRQHKEEIDKTAQEAKEEIRSMTAKSVRENPDKAREIASSREDYETPIDKAIAEAVAYQTDQKYELATEMWLAIANVAKGHDNETAAIAFSSAAYLIQEYDNSYKSYDEDAIKKVISLYSKALRIEPYDADVLNNRGVARADLGQHEEAIEDYDEALKIDPDGADALNNRGVARMDLGQHKKAIEDFNKVLDIDSNCVDALYNRALSRLESNDLEGAKHDIKMALQKDSKHDAAKELLANIENSRGDGGK